MATRIVVLGAGFGGLELATILSEELGEDADVVLIDKGDAFVFGFSKLDVMFGRETLESVSLPYRDFVKPGVRIANEMVTAIDPEERGVRTDAGEYEADILVVALGADYDLDATPGLADAGNEFYSFAGAERMRELLPDFSEGRAVVGVCGAPFKCPPAPSEAALLLHDRSLGSRRPRALRDHLPDAASKPRASVPGDLGGAPRGFRRAEHRVRSGRAHRLPGRGPQGRGSQGRARVRPRPLPRGPEASCPRRRSGFRDGRGGVCAGGVEHAEDTLPGCLRGGRRRDRWCPQGRCVRRGGRARRRRRGARGDPGGGAPAGYDGQGSCYVEFGGGRVGRVDVDFLSGPRPTGEFQAPSSALVAEKKDFGASQACPLVRLRLAFRLV